jgi:cell division protein FtsB
MPALKYITALWIAVLFYAVSSLLAGASGFSAYSQLSAEKEKLLTNIRRLQTINEEFTETKEALRYDADTISVYARELGYGGAGERFIRIAGLNRKTDDRMNAGEYFLPAEPLYVKDRTLRVISLAIALSMTVCLGIVDILRHVKEA